MDNYIIIEEWNVSDVTRDVNMDLNEFNESIRVEGTESGAEWVDQTQFAAIYNYMKRFNNSYNAISCELMITVNPIMDDNDDVEFEDIMDEFGSEVHGCLRKSDSIMRKGNSFYLLLPEMTEQNKLVVINRIKSRLQDNGVYYLVDISIDAMMIGPEMEYATWNKVAV